MYIQYIHTYNIYVLIAGQDEDSKQYSNLN